MASNRYPVSEGLVLLVIMEHFYDLKVELPIGSWFTDDYSISFNKLIIGAIVCSNDVVFLNIAPASANQVLVSRLGNSPEWRKLDMADVAPNTLTNRSWFREFFKSSIM